MTGAGKVKSVILGRYLSFLDKYPSILENRIPAVAVNIYRVFVIGFKDFITDVKDYVMIRKKVVVEPDELKSLSRNEMDIYFRMPQEMLKVSPVLLISALPFANYVVFPIAYHFPKHLLSSHFLSTQQKLEFLMEKQKLKIYHYEHVFRCLRQSTNHIRNQHMKKLVQHCLQKLGSGHHPTGREVMAIKTVFEFEPFSLKSLQSSHLKSLCRAHGLRIVWFKRRRLNEHAAMLCEIDAAILRDGIYDLKTDELRKACFFRGLNAKDTTIEEMTNFLHDWMSISVSVQPYAYSLLLHLPIFLAYNNHHNSMANKTISK